MQNLHQKQNGRLLRLTALLCLVAGLVFLLYPVVSQWVYDAGARRTAASYRERSAEIPADDMDWLYRMMVAYNEELYQSGQQGMTDPFTFEQVDFSLQELGFDEEMIGCLEIARLNLELPVYLGATAANMKRGAVHLTKTSLPVGGENTNCVIAAHRGLRSAKMFRSIHQIEIGDELTFTNFRETLTYRAVEIAVILPGEVDRILIQEGKDMITLFSCHPYRVNTHRYVVYFERVD